MGFTLAEANVLRGLSHNLIDARLDQRIEWRETARKRWHASIPSSGWNEITAQVRSDLHQVCSIVLDSEIDCKLIVSLHVGWVYTNQPELIDQLRALRCLSSKTYTQAVINRAKNTIALRKSQYQNRAYFYPLKLTHQQKQNLSNFLDNQQEHIRISPSLKTWANGAYLRTQEYFFIDYTNEQWLTMLSLVCPGLIRKTLKIVTK